MTTSSASGTLQLGGDLPVTRLGFGAMRLPDDDRAHQIIRLAVDLGITLIDTAPLYTDSERRIGEALRPIPADVRIATKVGIKQDGGEFVRRGRPEQIREDCEQSLRLLGLEEIDLSQLHDVDPGVPLEESLGAMADLQTEGKIRHIGVSNVTLEQLRRAQQVATIVSVQNRWNLVDRESAPVLDACIREQIAFLPWRPLEAEGLDSARQRVLLDAADRLKASPRQVALAWQLAYAPVMLPIPGTGSPDHLRANVEAVALVLTDEEKALLDSEPVE